MTEKELYLRRKSYVGSAIIEGFHVSIPSPTCKGEPRHEGKGESQTSLVLLPPTSAATTVPFPRSKGATVSPGVFLFLTLVVLRAK